MVHEDWIYNALAFTAHRQEMLKLVQAKLTGLVTLRMHKHYRCLLPKVSTSDQIPLPVPYPDN
jgi:hypothetical protein